MRKRHVLFFRPPMRDGNLYFRYEQYRGFLQDHGAEVRVVPPNRKGESFLRKLILYPIRMVQLFPELLWSDTVLLSPSPNMFWTVRLLKMLGKRVISEHYVSYLSHAEWINRFPEWMDRLSFSQLDHIITHTEPMKEGLEKMYHLQASKVSSLYCGVDLEEFRPRTAGEIRSRRQELGVENKFVVLYHGMHHTWHGMPVMLEAIRQLANEPNILFIVIPRSGFPDLPNVKYFGEELPFHEIPKYLAVADLWMSGFSPEIRGDRSFSSTMIQALAMGLPVLTSPTPEKEKWMTDGKNVLYVAPNNANDLAERIRELSRTREHLSSIGAEGRALAEQFFSFSEQGPRLKRIFLEPALS